MQADKWSKDECLKHEKDLLGFYLSDNPLLKYSDDLGELLNKNFNAMINQLKVQQEKLVISERHEAWENLARKLAHEIKNPLTPIQLSAERLHNKIKDKLKSVTKKAHDKNIFGAPTFLINNKLLPCNLSPFPSFEI